MDRNYRYMRSMCKGVLGRLVPFALAGGIGFVVDFTVLYVTIGVLGPTLGRALSWTCAVITTWAINRRAAFFDRSAREKILSELFRYAIAMIPGGLVNGLTYGIVMAMTPRSDIQILLAVSLGTLFGLLLNYFMAYYAVFSARNKL